MPNRPKRKKYDPYLSKRSNRKRNNGMELASGKFHSLFDLRMLMVQGCDLEKAVGDA